MKMPKGRKLIYIGAGVTVLVLAFVWWRKRRAGVSGEVLSPTGAPVGGASANEQNEAREARQNAEKLQGEALAAERTERAAERVEGRESREGLERSAAAERQATREEGAAQRAQVLAERQQEYEIHAKERELAAAPAPAPTAAAAVAAVAKHGSGTFATTTYKGKAAHRYSHAVKGGVGPGREYVILNTAKKRAPSGKPTAHARSRHTNHRPHPSHGHSVAPGAVGGHPSHSHPANHPAAHHKPAPARRPHHAASHAPPYHAPVAVHHPHHRRKHRR